VPYEHNAEPPYDHYWENGIKHDISLKTLYFEAGDGACLPCDNFCNSPYSVEAINKKAVAWIHTDDFNILAGTSMQEFIETIEKYGGKIYLERGDIVPTPHVFTGTDMICVINV